MSQLCTLGELNGWALCGVGGIYMLISQTIMVLWLVSGQTRRGCRRLSAVLGGDREAQPGKGETPGDALAMCMLEALAAYAKSHRDDG